MTRCGPALILAAGLASRAAAGAPTSGAPFTFRIVEANTTACEWHGEPAFTCRQLVAPVSVEVAFDPVPGRAVRLESDGIPVSETARPGAMGIGAEALPPGGHLMALSLVDAGRVTFSRTFRIDVAPRETGLPPPVVTFASPRQGDDVWGVVDVLVRAYNPRSQHRSVDRVDLLVDGRPLHSGTSEPFAIAWDTASWGAGRHVLTAIALGSGGQVGRAEAAVTVRAVRGLLPGGPTAIALRPGEARRIPLELPAAATRVELSARLTARMPSRGAVSARLVGDGGEVPLFALSSPVSGLPFTRDLASERGRRVELWMEASGGATLQVEDLDVRAVE